MELRFECFVILIMAVQQVSIEIKNSSDRWAAGKY